MSSSGIIDVELIIYSQVRSTYIKSSPQSSFFSSWAGSAPLTPMTPTREVTPTWEWPSWPVAPAACTCGRRDAGVAGGTGKSEESPNEITLGLADYRAAAAWVRSLTTAFWRGKFIAHLLDIVLVPWRILRSGDWPVILLGPPYWEKQLLAFPLLSESGLYSSRT